jgi:hypothetical protein
LFDCDINQHQNQELTVTNVQEDRVGEEIRDAIKIDGDAVRGHLDELVRLTVEETLNNLLDAEADELCGAMRDLPIKSILAPVRTTATLRRRLERFH